MRPSIRALIHLLIEGRPTKTSLSEGGFVTDQAGEAQDIATPKTILQDKTRPAWSTLAYSAANQHDRLIVRSSPLILIQSITQRS